MNFGATSYWIDVTAKFVTLILIVTWGGYTITNYLRRKHQAAMQKALLEKFASAHDFAEFLQSPAGQKYVTSLTDKVTSPSAAILNSIRIGLVLSFVGMGFLVGGQGAGSWAFRIGWVLFLAGLGFLASAAVSYFLAKKLALNSEE